MIISSWSQFLTRYGLQVIFVKQRDALIERRRWISRVLNLTRGVKYESDADRGGNQRRAERERMSATTPPLAPEWTALTCAVRSIAQLTGALEQIISGDQPLQPNADGTARQHAACRSL